MWVYQCAGCKELIRTGGATGGHIVPRSEGGADDDDNLRIECLDCNEAENIARLLNGATQTYLCIQRARQRRERSLLERRGRPPADPTDNQCARCKGHKGLSTFHFYPSWHPYRPFSAALPVCALCLDTFEIAYGVEITRAASRAIPRCWSERERKRAEKTVAFETWSRRRARAPLPADLCRRFQDLYRLDPFETSVAGLHRLTREAREKQRMADHAAIEAIAQRVSSLPLDFPGLFARIATGAYQLSPDQLPRVQLSSEPA
jgi:hypothetical protein